MKIVITSKNPVKKNATSKAFGDMFPDANFIVKEISVPSGVSEQPMSEKEALQGAKQRVENASKEISDADFIVGIEGGIEIKGAEMEAFAWIYILDKNKKVGKARTGTFVLPEKNITLNQSRNGIRTGRRYCIWSN